MACCIRGAFGILESIFHISVITTFIPIIYFIYIYSLNFIYIFFLAFWITQAYWWHQCKHTWAFVLKTWGLLREM